MEMLKKKKKAASLQIYICWEGGGKGNTDQNLIIYHLPQPFKLIKSKAENILSKKNGW